MKCVSTVDYFYFFNIYIVFFQPDISPEVRRKLGEAAVKAAKAVNYVGAGETHTVTATRNTHNTDVILFVSL